ncbi:retron St85 family effector protein [Methylophaga sp.]|uniref:retron St85 family effector protein n=1 Tax=Methylophaga sp. TaxID=2024840 RepID=UPI0025E5C093|nr:retron St85 family effector protein [Methylophaga sp.]
MSIAYENALIHEFQQLDINKFTVDLSDNFIFTCGGEVNPLAIVSPSFRDRFLHYTAKKHPIIYSGVVLAEAFKDYFRDNFYTDLLVFESDIAQLSSVILVFLESPGSLVELGMFCSKPQSYKKLVIVADRDKVEAQDSFIYLGPLEYIKRKHSNSVAIYPWPDPAISEYDDSRIEDLCHILNDKIERLDKSQKLSQDNSGHISLLISEIVSICYPILLSDIELVFQALDVDISQNTISRYLYLLSILGLIAKEPYSSYQYYYPTNPDRKRINFSLTKTDKRVDVINLRMRLMQSFISANDPISAKRRNAQKQILEKLGGASK